HRVRRPPPPGEAGAPRAGRRPSPSEGLRPDDPRGQALARRRSRGRGNRGMINALVAVAGQSFVNDWFGNFWLALIAKVIIVLGFVLVAPVGVIYAELKIMAHMQHRLGPMYAGRFHGIGPPIADGIKLIQKEDVIPTAADSWIFSLAPAVVLVPYIALFIVIPFSNSIFAESFDVGIFYVLAITTVSVIGFLMAGWASANKF